MFRDKLPWWDMGNNRRGKKKKEALQSVVLVPTSRETLSQFKWRGLLTHTVPLELAVQLSTPQWAHSPTSGFTSWQSYSTVTAVQIKSAGTFSVSKVRLLLPTRCTDMVQILNPMTPLFWPMEWAESVCLGSTRDRTSCQSLWEKFLSGNQTCSVHSEPRHTFSISGSLFYCSAGYHRLTCILTERGDNPFHFFFLTLTRGICLSFLSELANLQTTSRHTKPVFFCSLCENVPHIPCRCTDCIIFWTFEDRYTIKDDRFVSYGHSKCCRRKERLCSAQREMFVLLSHM